MTLGRSAWHEAAHCLVAEAVGITVYSVEMFTSTGMGRPGTCITETGVSAHPYANALTIAAGWAGELLLGDDMYDLGERVGGDAMDLTRAGWSSRSQAAFRDYAGQLLDANRAMWARLACVLDAGGEFSGDQVRAALRPAPQVAGRAS